MTEKKYVLDSNVFVEAFQRYYAFDLVPRFWDCLLEQNEAGHLYSIDRVKTELDKGKDALTDWATDIFCDAFESTDDPDTIKVYADIMSWAYAERQYTDAARAKLASCADGWLVAYASVYDLTVVTHEEYAPEAKANIKIPNICKAFSVDYANTFEMLRDLEVTL